MITNLMMRNPAVADNPNAKAMLEVVSSGDQAKGEEIAEQQNLINALNLAQSQANQNQYLVNQLRPCPTPAYITCNPWATNGTAYTGGSCCGCGC